MARCPHTEPWPVCCAVVSVWLICNKTWHFKSPVCATSDNKPPLRSLSQCVDSAAPRWQCFLSRLCAEPGVVWYRFNLAEWKKCFFICVPSELLVLPCPRLHSRWHICICLFAETSPWLLCHDWRPPVISLVALCEMGHDLFHSLFSIYLAHSIPHCSACVSRSHARG